MTTTNPAFLAICVLLPVTALASSTPASPQDCGKTFSAQSGVFKSPNYPLEYENNMKCGQTFEASVGQVVQLTFADFQVEEGGENDEKCGYDKVIIYDGPDENSPQIRVHCGTKVPEPVRSSGRYLYLYFETDSYYTMKGFKGTYKEVSPNFQAEIRKLKQLVEELKHVETSTVYLEDDRTWMEEGNVRTLFSRVNFNKQYKTIPAVSLGIMRLDSDNDENLRIECYIELVDILGFNYKCRTWSTSRIYTVGFSWMSVPR